MIEIECLSLTAAMVNNLPTCPSLPR